MSMALEEVFLLMLLLLETLLVLVRSLLLLDFLEGSELEDLKIYLLTVPAWPHFVHSRGREATRRVQPILCCCRPPCCRGSVAAPPRSCRTHSRRPRLFGSAVLEPQEQAP